MNVIFDTTDVEERASLGADDAANIRVESFGDVRRNPWIPMFRTEDDVQEKL